MTELRMAADMAYPIDFGLLPDDVEAVLGYVGGDTPHVWSDLEVESAQRSGKGRQWWPIVTLPERALATADGWAAAAVMIAALPVYGLSWGTPCFIDCEHDAWTTNPAGALAAINGWKAHMRAAGYLNVFAYVPLDAGFDWVADWDNTEPGELPAGWIGKQYGGNSGNGAYDLSVFDASLWDMAHGATLEPTEPGAPGSGDTEEEDDMALIAESDDGKFYVCPLDFSHKRWIVGPTDAQALIKTGKYTQVKVTAGFMATVPDATNQS